MKTEELIKSLCDENSYPHPVKYIKKLETHISWVFLTGDFAYKIKKPVDFGFLNFLTLEKRKYFCEKEVELNKELTDIYLKTVEIKRDENGKIKIGGKGETIEYGVMMKELPQEAMMSHLLSKNKVTLSMINEVAKIIAMFHLKAKTDSTIARYGKLKTVKFNWDENFTQTKSYIGKTIKDSVFENIKTKICQFIDQNQKLFEKRVKDKKIKYCHGDLHLNNIFVHKDKIYIFDRIEFNLRFACSDTAADLAFLLMDFEFHDKKYFSDFLLDRYLSFTKDYEMLKLIDFYKCYRAYVRGKVTSFAYDSTPSVEIKNNAEAYFLLADRYANLLFMPPQMFIICGLPGTGKTTLSEELAKRVGAIHIRSDAIRRLIAKAPLDKHLYAPFEHQIYSKDITEKTYNTMNEKAKTCISSGKGVILDATFFNKAYLERAREVGMKFGVKPHIICCMVDDTTAKERIEQKEKSDLQSDATWEIYKKLKLSFQPPKGAIILNTKAPKEDLIREILKNVK